MYSLLFSVVISFTPITDEDGGYTEWSEWSECSATCGGGSRTHSRTCTNPPVKNGGKTCEEQDLGPAEESEECNTQECRKL